ncbi:MAG TPA: hypothetical protein PKM41_11125 [Deltaproteobacteria bacterium]|jgi:hypothetical protein|nr:hypothetical protein [Deltaproteobacteria bacterium]HOI07263.1 hypothetical protein [Deltaproteobacteria bacterium]
MNISRIGIIQALLSQNQNTSSSSNMLENILLGSVQSRAALYTLPTEKESFRMEIELKDGTSVTIDYTRQGVLSKTTYELGRYGNYTYGNDLFSPENTAKRILSFARALWDGSPEKLEVLANAIEEGVRQARRSLGSLPGWLDAMIGRTVDLLNQGVEDMKAEALQAA